MSPRRRYYVAPGHPFEPPDFVDLPDEDVDEMVDDELHRRAFENEEDAA
jgi:hypothetical protein